MSDRIEFSKVRDFGQVINDSIGFVKDNFKPLMRPVLYIGLALIIVSIASSIFVQFRTLDSLSMIRMGTFDDALFAENYTSSLWLNYLLTLISTFLAHTVVQLTTFSYIYLYIAGGNKAPTQEEVWAYFKAHIGRFTLISLILFVILVILTAMCVVPGLYFFPVISLVYAAVIFEQTSVGDGFNRAFALIKDNWWKTFGVLFVVWLITSMSIGFFALPGTILTFMGTIFGESNTMALTGAVITVVVQSFGIILYAVPSVAGALCFYSLKEEKEGTSIAARIEAFGTESTGRVDRSDEEY